MSPHTIVLHRRVIRLLKGCLTAWEEWLRDESQKPKSDQSDSNGG